MRKNLITMLLFAAVTIGLISCQEEEVKIPMNYFEITRTSILRTQPISSKDNSVSINTFIDSCYCFDELKNKYVTEIDDNFFYYKKDGRRKQLILVDDIWCYYTLSIFYDFKQINVVGF